MLVEFRVGNYRSLREEQCLSMVAGKDKAHQEHLLNPNAAATPDLLKTVALYGANASGKSNIVYALAFMKALISESATLIKEGQLLNCPPFKLDSTYSTQPSLFEATFVLDGVRYQYGFKLKPERVVEEWLLVYKSAKPQQWFTREWDDKNKKYSYKFSSFLSGPRSTWEEATRGNALFLSTAVQLNSELLRPIFLWFTQKLIVISADISLPINITTQLLQDVAYKEMISEFLRTADFGIDSIELDKRKGFMQTVNFDISTGTSNSQREERDIMYPIFTHKSADASARFEMHEESQGTQRVYALAGPIFQVIKHSMTLVIDELDSHLHPLMVRHLLELFHAKTSSDQCAQLFFTTHDTSLLDLKILRRDQIWFIEKGSDQSSKLYPLSDFSPRNKEALERGYLIGRYGALPFFSQKEMH